MCSVVMFSHTIIVHTLLNISSCMLWYVQLAALNGFDELVQVLLDNGADPLARTEV